MARIRSTHATQWNDDDFLDCSPFARLLALALRNFADDQGVFEWKPKQIKRNCLPADTSDVVPLLKELVEHLQVKMFTVDGKDYGAIRNFRKWQRPKSPNSIYPMTDEIRKYVGITASDYGNGEPSRDPISEIDDADDGCNSEKPEADVGCRVKDVGDISSLRSDSPGPKRRRAPKDEEHPDFPAFYDQYPKKADPRDAAKAYAAARKRGATAEQLLDGARRYALERRGEPEQYTKKPRKWLEGDCWKNGAPANGPVDLTPAAKIDFFGDPWRPKLTLFKERNGFWLSTDGPPPTDPDTCVPRRLLIEFGFFEGPQQMAKAG